MQKNAQEKLARIIKLKEEIDRLQAELESLLLSQKEVIILPPDFSLNDEVMRIIKDAGEKGVSIREILGALLKKFPKYDIRRDKVASSLAYLKSDKKKLIVAAEQQRGVYRENINA